MNAPETRPTLLVVDDDPISLELLCGLLETEYHCLCAADADEALARLDSGERPALAVFDVNMPGMDGYALCRRLKDDGRFDAIPIIFVTTEATPDAEARGLELGAVDFIAKPFNATVVRARIKTHMRLKAQTELLESLAWIDGLTELPNRRRFDSVFELEWKRASREERPLSALFIDIDHFKDYNDCFGHGAGDDCLKRVAEALRSVLKRPADLVARYGGEEFAAVLPDTDGKGAERVAERMREAVETLAVPHCEACPFGRVTVSIGAATALPSARGASGRLLELADRMLYQAKSDGKNRVRFAQM